MSSRRSFLSRVGAGVSAALAGSAVAASPAQHEHSDTALRLVRLEAEQALRKLHRQFEQALDAGLYDDAVMLFADDAEVIFNGGVFVGRNRGLSRLFRERFAAGRSGRRIERAPGFELAAAEQQESLTVAADLQSATAVFPYSIQVGMPVESENSLAAMARLNGDGVRFWWEGGVYRVSYRQTAPAGNWQIARLQYETRVRADYRSGRSYARPIEVAPLRLRYPADPAGPDALV